MNTSVIVLVGLFAVCFAVPKPADNKYTDKYDSIDYKKVLTNERLLKAYTDCLLEVAGAKCSPEGTELKTRIPDALKTECAKCTEKQKEGIKFVISYLVNKKPELWKQLKTKYDGDGKFSAKYEELAKKEGVPL